MVSILDVLILLARRALKKSLGDENSDRVVTEPLLTPVSLEEVHLERPVEPEESPSFAYLDSNADHIPFPTVNNVQTNQTELQQ